MLDTVVGKVINGKTLKNMQLIKRFTPLSSDLSESTVVSDLMANFPPICKKDTLAVQMALLSDHFANTGERIGLNEVPEDMPGGKLPVEKGRKAKRKELTQEEYLEGENPSKKAKKEKALEKSKTGASEGSSIQEEVQDLNPEAIIQQKTRNGKPVASASTTTAKQIPQKKKRTPKPRKLRESVYTSEESAAVEAQEVGPSNSQAERVSPMFVMTPEMAKRSKEHTNKLMAEKKRKMALYKLQRDEKLKEMGLEDCDKFYLEKISEVQEISKKVDEEALKASEDAATKLVTREVRKKKKADAEAL